MSLIRSNGGLRTKNLFPRTSFFNDIFETDWPGLDLDTRFESNWVPAANIIEGDKEFSVELSVPGYTKKDIHVEVDNNNVLQITGEREEEVKEEKNSYKSREFSYGSFSRSFKLPETVNEEKIAASCKDGVLNVKLPKKETAILKKKHKEIQIA